MAVRRVSGAVRKRRFDSRLPAFLCAVWMSLASACRAARSEDVEDHTVETTAAGSMEVARVSESTSGNGSSSASETPPIATSPTPSVPPAASSDASQPPRPRDLPFIEWLATHCRPDAVGPSPYTVAWSHYRHPADLLAADDPQPLVNAGPLPAPGSHAARALTTRLREEWMAHPRSHVVDCVVSLPTHGASGPSRSTEQVRYVAYLPDALFEGRFEVGAILLLVPGGNGGRSRPFLRPIPGATIYEKGSGGLDTKRLADHFYGERPSAGRAIIVALDTSGFGSGAGSNELLTDDLYEHVRATFAPALSGAQLAHGVEGTSSGARATMRAAFAKPDAFDTLGFTCMACGGVNPQSRLLGTPEQLAQFADRLAERRRRGEVDLRFSIGSRDNQLPCNRAFWELFRREGVVGDGDDDHFLVYEGALHDFAFMERSYGPQLLWHLTALDRIAQKKRQRG